MKIFILIAALIFASGANVSAAGFIGPGSPRTVHQAADVLKASDDAPCLLTGHIKARVMGRKNRYIFEDASGSVVVEIKRKVFRDATITPETLVRLEGEVDTSDKYPNEVEVDSLTVAE